MTRPRYLTAQEVFDAFPGIADDMRNAPTRAPPQAFLKTLLASATPEDAITFCAYALDRREAVWWACQCVRLLLQVPSGQEDPYLLAAETWVREPEDAHRREALRIGSESDHRTAGSWLALAAGWSGGNVAVTESAHVLATPTMTPKGVRTAILVALARVPARERGARLRACVEAGMKLMRERSDA